MIAHDIEVGGKICEFLTIKKCYGKVMITVTAPCSWETARLVLEQPVRVISRTESTCVQLKCHYKYTPACGKPLRGQMRPWPDPDLNMWQD